jgi:pimeloyl-ACP methyl ester carboxylesterase
MQARRLNEESIFIDTGDGNRLHMKRIVRDEGGAPVFMIHGMIENGCVFYSRSGKGLAYYLASSGYDVFVGDLRGRGRSVPPVGPGSSFGQTEEITRDLPAFIAEIARIRKGAGQIWIAHSWGGVLVNSFLVRFPAHIDMIERMVFFGAKRQVLVWNAHKAVFIDLVWKFLCRRSALRRGYLDARALRLGSDNESVKSHLHCATWASPSAWVDPDDGFDYAAAAKHAVLPPALYLAGAGDRSLGHPSDVKVFMEESGAHRAEYRVLGKKHGGLRNYGHVDMLTHPDCERDHFPRVINWLNGGPFGD